MSDELSDKTNRIRTLNDLFRKHFIGGRILLTNGVSSLPAAQISELLAAVRSFSDFTDDNDPHGEHDFGSIEMKEAKYFWKIDYYCPSMTYGSADAADPSKTVRVLSVMMAAEY